MLFWALLIALTLFVDAFLIALGPILFRLRLPAWLRLSLLLARLVGLLVRHEGGSFLPPC